MATQVVPAQFLFGTHSLAVLQQACVQSQQVFNQSAAIATVPPATVGGTFPGPSYLWGTHTLALLQEHAGRSSQVFHTATLPLFPGIGMARVFILADAELPEPTPSGVVVNSALISSVIAGQTPILSLILVPPQYPLDPPYTDIYSPAPPPFVAPITNFLVQATAIGWSMGFDPIANAPTGELILRAPGDVFYVAVANFADSSIDYLAGQPGSPFFGWMKQVPPGTPLTNPTHSGVPFYDYQPPPRRNVF